MRACKGKEKHEMPIIETLTYHQMSSRLSPDCRKGVQAEFNEVTVGQEDSSEHTGYEDHLVLKLTLDLKQWNNCIQEHSRMILFIFYNMYSTGNEQSEKMSAKRGITSFVPDS